MPKRAPELSPIEVKRKSTKPGFWAVGGVAGLHLLVVAARSAKTTASWILRVMLGEKRTDLGLGAYPEIGVAKAREKAAAARELIAQGKDPREEKRAAKAALLAQQARALTFDEAAKQAHKNRAHEFSNAKHVDDWLSSLERYASPVIGSMPVAEVEIAHVVRVLEPIWTTKTETATRVRQRIESVLSWATVSGYRTGDNPAQWKGRLEHALPRPSKVRKVEHHAALPWHEVPQFMADLRKRDGMAAKALEFIILTAARSGEARLAQWGEIDVEAKLWTVPAERMKARKVHRVPLSDRALKLLETVPRFEGSPYVFPAVRGGALSDMSISAVCRRMGVDAVPHGFRSSFKDWARSSTAYPDEVSELALAHVNSDATRAAYARDELLPQRTKLMNAWAKFCATVPKSGGVSHIGRRRG
jgi:integrase